MVSNAKTPRSTSIRNRIVLFALLVTLVPSVGLGWFYFKQAEQALLQSSQRELLATADQVKREFGLWFKARFHDMRVLSSSDVLSEGLENHQDLHSAGNEDSHDDAHAQLARFAGYLSVVHAEFRDYVRLLIFDREAALIAQSPRRSGAVALPGDWREQLRQRNVIFGPLNSTSTGAISVLAAVPVLSAQGQVLGFLAAEIRLNALANIMYTFLEPLDIQANTTELMLVEADGRVIQSTRPDDGSSVGPAATAISQPSAALAEYSNRRGVPVVGIHIPVTDFQWLLVIEKQRDKVLSAVIELRNRTLPAIALMVLTMGFLAYILGRGIAKPLERLTRAAGAVADGDLDVSIPVKRHDELGKAAHVFNDMVTQLRHSRERLEQLSTIDELTQLPNRRRILEKLSLHIPRFRRGGTRFSVLLIDADHFKRINDNAGHVVGDEVLARLGQILRRLIRSVDAAGRYGGEEFLVILDETRGAEAMQTANRIRLTVESTTIATEHGAVNFTISIGVAEISAGEDEKRLIMRADNALYQAKHAGRNQTVLARSPDDGIVQHPTVRDR